MSVVFFVLFVFCPIAAFLFYVRALCSLFSSKVSGQMGRHPVIHAIWGCLAFLVVLDIFGGFHPSGWILTAIDRRTERKQVIEQVQLAGGWAALQKACDALVEQNRDEVFYWHRGSTNALPATLTALKPWDIQFIPPAVLRERKQEPQVAVVRIKFFGMHSTGGHSTPYFGLEVVSGPGAETYKPTPSLGGASGNGYRRYRAVTDRIYEIY